MRYRSQRDMGKRLREIYKDGDGKIPDLKHFDHRQDSALRKVLIVLIFFFAFLAAVTWLGFFVFSQGRGFSGEGVKLEIEGPSEAVSGKPLNLKIKYKNNERVPLGKVELFLNFPLGFAPKSFSPEPSQADDLKSLSLNWKLGSLGAGVQGEVAVEGIFLGTVESSAAVQAVLIYKPANFNSEFQKVAHWSFKVFDSLVAASIEAPDKAIPGEEIEFNLIFQNKSEMDLPKVKIAARLPPHFIFKSSEPKANSEGEWVGEKLSPQSEGKLKIKGVFASEAAGIYEFRFLVSLPGENENFIVQRDIPATVEVVRGDLILSLILNGKSESGSADFGDKLQYSIAYNNQGKEDLIGVEITMNILSLPLDSFLDRKNIFINPPGKVSGSQIIWAKKEIGNLNRLKSSQEGNIDISLNLNEPPVEFKTADYRVEAWVEAKISRVGAMALERKVSSTKIITLINSDLKFNAQARYYNDDEIAVGVGPHPPKVGQTTAYRIFWKITNSLHEVEDLNVSTVLPEGVEFTGKINVDAGDLRFDSSSRKVSWKVNKIPLLVPELKADFEVSITPADEKAGNVLILTQPSTLTGRDTQTKGLLSRVQAALDTNLAADPVFEGKGAVEK